MTKYQNTDLSDISDGSQLSKDKASQYLVDINQVTRRYGSLTALDNVSLKVPRGAVFGLVGANGAGKTTMIKHVMGLLRPQSGSVSVFGRNPVTEPVEVLSNIGYLSEINDLPDWMRVDEIIQYTQSFYKNWDASFAADLKKSFELQESKRIKQMSKGQRARVGLLLALAHRPELLVLDEPSSGLDPLVRRDILRAIIRTISQEGRTVLFSSHLLDEVERVADYIAIIESGKIVRCDTLEALQSSFHHIPIRLDEAQADQPDIDGVVAWSGAGHHWTALVEGDAAEFQITAERIGISLGDPTTPSLNEIFVALVGDPMASPAMEVSGATE